MHQTCADIECILIDDGSCDSSVRICDGLIKKYKGPILFQIIKLEGGNGPSGCRNVGTDAAHGDYIFYLDGDDEITEECIEKLVAKALLFPEVEMVFGGIWAEKKTNYYDMSKYEGYEHVIDNTWLRREFFKIQGGLPTVVWNKLIKKSFLKKNRICFEPDVIHEDELWMYNVIKHLSNVCFVPDITYKHYSVPGSVMNNLQIEYSNKSWSIILKKIVSTMNEPLLDMQIRKYLFVYLQKESQIERTNYGESLLDCFLTVTKGKIRFALFIYKALRGKSLRIYLNHYCITGVMTGLMNQIYYDIKSLVKNV